MVSTFLLLLIFFVLIGGSLVLFGLFLQLGLSLVKCQESSFKNLKRATLLIFVADVVLRISFLFAPLSENHNSGAIYMALAFLAGLATPVLIIAYVFQLSIFRAGIAWLVTIPQAIAVALIVLFMKPVVGEAYVASANSMSPTILGPHIEFPCSRCDSICFCSPNRSDVRSLRTPSFNSRAICENFHVNSVNIGNEKIHAADRFLASPLIIPERWDLIVFKQPSEPSVVIVKRLVGLPGEEIQIENGQVYVDGKIANKPQHIQSLSYETDLPDRGLVRWGTKQSPAKLRNDEYFVLGDFSIHSSDSRLWVSGTPGHSPFAVPKENILGTVTHTYWPLNRIRIHR